MERKKGQMDVLYNSLFMAVDLKKINPYCFKHSKCLESYKHGVEAFI